MENVRVIFFDLYNTLVFLPENTNPYLRFFHLCGISDIIQLKKAIRIVLTEDLPSFQAVAERLNVEYDKKVEHLTSVLNEEILQAVIYNDAIEVLRDIKNKGCGLCVISNLATQYKRPVFELGLNAMCDEFIFSCDVGYMKPEKDIFILACNKMGISPNQGLMIGDSAISDYRGALNAGMEAILLRRNLQKHDPLIVF